MTNFYFIKVFSQLEFLICYYFSSIVLSVNILSHRWADGQGWSQQVGNKKRIRKFEDRKFKDRKFGDQIRNLGTVFGNLGIQSEFWGSETWGSEIWGSEIWGF